MMASRVLLAIAVAACGIPCIRGVASPRTNSPSLGFAVHHPLSALPSLRVAVSSPSARLGASLLRRRGQAGLRTGPGWGWGARAGGPVRRGGFAGRTVCMAGGPVEDAEGELVDAGDIVEFRAHGLVTLGFIEAVGGDGELEIVRLVRREGVGEECYLDESQPVLSVSPGECRFIDSYPSQRVAWSTASPHHNPHGEESEDVWFIEGSTSDDCEVPVKPISET